VLAVGAVTWCISEPVFWARLTGEGNDPGDAAFTGMLYCAVTYIALVALRHFRVADLAGLFLIGGIVGWLIEGAVVSEVYTNLPVSLVWTSLAWHALLTVCGGWWLLPAVLRRGGWRPWLLCGLLGIAWALWSLDPALDDDVATLAGPSFVVLACGVTAALSVGYGLADRYPVASHALTPGVPFVAVAIGLGAWATAATFVPAPYAPPILVALLGVAVWALRRMRDPGRPTDDAPPTGFGVPTRRLLPLSAFALTSSGTNVALVSADPSVPAVAIAFMLLVTTAVVVLVWTLRLAWRAPGRRRPTSA
jgi:hypothetical protein